MGTIGVMTARILRPLVVLVLGATVAACTTDAGEDLLPEPTGETAQGPLTLRVMEFNVEYGGTEVDFDSVPKVIEASGADIVAIEEGYGNMPAIAGSVGWHFDPRSQVMSRFPLLVPPGDQPFIYVEVAPGFVVAVANVHLPSVAYGPFKIRDGASADEVLAVEERKRVSALAPALAAVEALAAQGFPVFLIGDFNAPSHLDWTEAAVAIRDHVLFPLAWPASVAVEEAGLVDSFREANPDPVEDPGITWPADRPFVQGYNPFRAGAAADRIDFVYAGGPVVTVQSQLVGEQGGPGVDIAVTPWPTDHRATVSTFEVEPAAPPTIVSIERRLVTEGDKVFARFYASQGGGFVAFVPAGGDRSDALDQVATHEGDASGEVDTSTRGWIPGPYEAVLISFSGAELVRAPFWVQAVGGEPEIGTVRATSFIGEPIEVVWRFTPGNRADWVGVYRRDADPNRASYLSWVYTGGTVEGSAVFDADAPGPWPLEPGAYTVYLLRDDSYVALAAGDFRVGLATPPVG